MRKWKELDGTSNSLFENRHGNWQAIKIIVAAALNDHREFFV
jgi:hypothetical protein